MITMPVVKTCPYTVAGSGVMKLSHKVINTLAGAVYDKNEWLALLIGTRSEDGMNVLVNELHIPRQYRGSADCSLVKQEPLGPEVVGVVHSHHSMKAFFSHTDDTTLNPRFPSSLVVAQLGYQGDSEVEQLLGFAYRAEGRAALPCQTTGVIGFMVSPHPLIPEWPVTLVAGYGAPQLTASFHECPHLTRTREGLLHHCKAACGASTTEKAMAIFGRDGGKPFLHEVHKQTQGRVNNQFPIHINDQRWHGKKNKGGYWGREDDEAGYLRHWGEY